MKQILTYLLFFSFCLRAYPQVADTYCNRGYLYNRLHQYVNAIEDFSATIRIDPECTGAYLGRGRSYLGLYRFEDALNDINKAISLDQEFPSGHILRSLIFRMMGNEIEAKKEEKYFLQIQQNKSFSSGRIG